MSVLRWVNNGLKLVKTRLDRGVQLKKILVIDDEIAIRDLIELVLRRENYDVQTAEDGKTGMHLLDSFQPDIVVLDLMLPDCSDMTCARKLPENVPFQ